MSFSILLVFSIIGLNNKCPSFFPTHKAFTIFPAKLILKYMERYNFKDELTPGVFRLLGRVLMPSFIMSLIFVVIIAGVGMVIVPDLSAEGEDFKTFLESRAEYESDELTGIMQEKIMNIFSLNMGSFIPLLILLVLGTFIFYNFSYNLSRNEVEKGNNSFAGALGNLFDKRILHYLVLSIIIGGLYQFLNYLVQMTGNAFILFIFAVTVGPVYYWFSLTYAAVGIGNMSFSEALSFTQSELTLGRVARVLGISILLSIALAVAGVIVGLLGILVANIPVVGVFLAAFMGVFLFAIFSVFILSGFTGLYYRYLPDAGLESEEQFIVTD
tara:strand:- start:244 stop:1227 length:984 start_codon:yes stop_codon:yes gene_type:complete